MNGNKLYDFFRNHYRSKSYTVAADLSKAFRSHSQTNGKRNECNRSLLPAHLLTVCDVAQGASRTIFRRQRENNPSHEPERLRRVCISASVHTIVYLLVAFAVIAHLADTGFPAPRRLPAKTETRTSSPQDRPNLRELYELRKKEKKSKSQRTLWESKAPALSRYALLI